MIPGRWVILSLLLVATLAPMTWQALPSWARPERAGGVALRFVDGTPPPGESAEQAVAAFGIRNGVLIRVGNGVAVGRDRLVVSLYSTAADLEPSIAGGLWLGRNLNVLWAGRREKATPVIERALVRVEQTFRAVADEIILRPRFHDVYLPRLRAAFAGLLEIENVGPAQDRAFAAMRSRIEAAYLPLYGDIFKDALRKVVESRIQRLMDTVYQLLGEERSDSIDAEGLLDEIQNDPRTSATTREMLTDLFFQPEVLDYTGQVAERVVAEVARDPEVRAILADLAADPAFRDQFERLGEQLETEIREIVAATILTEDRSAIDPLAAITLRGVISRRDRSFLLLGSSGELDRLHDALAPHAAAVLER